MDFSKWDSIEKLLDQYNITPLVAVIPENRDPSINFAVEQDAYFWDKVNTWVGKGWTLALHGLHHSLFPSCNSSLSFSNYSEFTGLSFSRQLDLLKQGFKILLSHGISTNYFIAPAHGFDSVTIKALLTINPSIIISDGLGIRPYISSDGISVLPQQLWKYRWLPFGLWTICLHPSTMSELEILNLKRAIHANPKLFRTDITRIKFSRFSLLDKFVQVIHQFMLHIKQF